MSTNDKEQNGKGCVKAQTVFRRLPGAPQYILSPKHRTREWDLVWKCIVVEVIKFKIERRQVSLWELRQTQRLGGEGNGKTGRAWSDRSVSLGSPPRSFPKRSTAPWILEFGLLLEL